MKILLIGALPRSLINFRGPLIKDMLAKGHKLFVASNGRDPGTEANLGGLGVEYYPIRIARAGMNPMADIITLFDLIQLMWRIKPDAVLSYTIKPVIYGGLAARLCGIQNIFSMIEGLGRVFVPQGSLSHVVSSFFARGIYRIGLLSSKRVFFLNPDDLHQFIKSRYIPERKTVLLNGIGIDLAYYAREELPAHSCIRFLMIARLLKEKGVREYVAAARILRAWRQNVKFELVGSLDEGSSSIKQAELDSWQREGIINYVGRINDVRPLYRDCHIYVLPSYYREGLPRTLLEAMAMGRAVITTDVPGCKEAVKFCASGTVLNAKENTARLKIGRNGILVPARNIEALADAMEFFIKHSEQITVMGSESRRYAEERYDVHEVNAVMIREMELAQ